MVDLGFSGLRYTWTNRREISSLIQERIDRFSMNPSWCLLYPDAKVLHLTRCHSNHCPVLLETNPSRQLHVKRPFKFQSIWLSNPSFPNVVKQAWQQPRKLLEAIEVFSRQASLWNKNHFGIIFQKKKRVLARLDWGAKGFGYPVICPSSSARVSVNEGVRCCARTRKGSLGS